jgi:hypothetical protein
MPPAIFFIWLFRVFRDEEFTIEAQSARVSTGSPGGEILYIRTFCAQSKDAPGACPERSPGTFFAPFIAEKPAEPVIVQ